MDGLTAKINYDFLNELKRRGYLPFDLRIKYNEKDSKPRAASIYTNYKTLESVLSEFSFVVKDRRYLCYSGKLSLIENMKIQVTSKDFSILFSIFNVTDSVIIKKSVSYDSKRGELYTADMNRIEAVIKELIDKYTRNIKNAIDVRINSYMDPCYVDAGYVSPNSN